jgi:hypothetical protein
VTEENAEIFKGNESSDFQPATQDPQDDVGGGLQPVSGGLQPVTGESGSHQALPSVQSLKVENSGKRLEQSASTQNNPVVQDDGFPLPLTMGFVFLMIVMVAIIWLSNPNKSTDNASTDIPEPEQEQQPNKSKKKSRKKRARNK